LHDSNGDVVAVFTNGTPESPKSEYTPGVLKIMSNALAIVDDIVTTHTYVVRRGSTSVRTAGMNEGTVFQALFGALLEGFR